jgi:hypothetical protein
VLAMAVNLGMPGLSDGRLFSCPMTLFVAPLHLGPEVATGSREAVWNPLLVCRDSTFMSGKLQWSPTDKSRQGRVPPVASSLPVLVLGMGLLTGLNPVRLGLAVLVISRPRPVQNLLAYWFGCIGGCISGVVLPLTLLHVAPIFKSFADHWAASSAARNIRIGMGVVALLAAVLMTALTLARRRHRAQLKTRSGDTSTLMLDSNTPPAISRLLGRIHGEAEGGSAIRRLLRRVHNAWQNGSVWIAFVIGIAFGGVEPEVALFVLAMIVTSGAAIGTQVSAAIAFIVGVLAVIEIILVSYLAMPAKTQVKVQLLHDWAWAHRQQVVIAILAVAGVSAVVQGVSM